MSVRIEQPGMHSTLQDLGRWGYQRFGVSVSGAMDACSLRLANLLLQNKEHAAALEMTLVGPTLGFQEDALIAYCGGEFSATINSEPLPIARPVLVRKGSVIVFGPTIVGRCSYLAVAGGFDVPLIMGSRSTYTRASFGGCAGRCLQAGDLLAIGQPSANAQRLFNRCGEKETSGNITSTRWHVGPLLPISTSGVTMRVLLGSEFDWLTPESQRAFLASEFSVSSQADRMGFRLGGPPLMLKEPRELVSEAVSHGTIQLPASGQPILLMADCATTGGYPKIAHVASVDLRLAAQSRSGTKLRFQPITLEQSHALIRERERHLSILKCGLALKWEQELWLNGST